MSRRSAGDRDAVYTVTSAQTGHSDELGGRIVRYAWMMGIRVACFVLAILTPSPWRWILLVGAVFLPYFAVVMANARRGGRGGQVAPFDQPGRPQLDTKK